MSDLHIASCVAFVLPTSLAAVERAIRASGLAEIARSDGQGRLVLLIEGASSRAVVDVIEATRALDGVLAVHLAYQHAEPSADLEEMQP